MENSMENMHNDVRVTRFKRLLAGSQALAQKKD